jgi:hypothetical protein
VIGYRRGLEGEDAMTARTAATRGRRLPAAALLVAAACMAPAGAAAELTATPDTPFGWRGDGSGRFGDATPVTEWSQTKNVLWRTPMPDRTNSQPVLAGEVLFTCAEPTTLLCLRRADGEILWQRAHDYVDLLPPAEKERAQKELLAAERIRKIELAPVLSKLQEVNRRLNAMPDDPFLRRQRESLKRQRDAVEKKLTAFEEHRNPKGDPLLGLSNCTPVTDGEGVFCLFGNGVGAVYDLKGSRRWLRLIRRPGLAMGHSMSPVLGGRALVMSIDKEILAVDATTGRELWTVGTYRPSAGLAAAKVGRQAMVVTSEGSVIRAADGKIVARVVGAAQAPTAAPVIRNDVLYLLGAKQQLLIELLSPNDEAGVRLERLAAGERSFLGVYYASPLYHDGCVYLWEKSNVLSVVAAKSGRRLVAKQLRLGGTAFASPTLGGGCIFVGSDNGTMAVLKPMAVRSAGGKYRLELDEVARNVLEPGRSPPVFAGRHMYVRTNKHMYCIGAKEGSPGTR